MKGCVSSRLTRSLAATWIDAPGDGSWNMQADNADGMALVHDPEYDACPGPWELSPAFLSSLQWGNFSDQDLTMCWSP